MRRPQQRITRGQVAGTSSRSAAVGGWNARDSIADMPEGDAVQMINMIPRSTSVDLRDGYTVWASGFAGQVNTLMGYNPPSGAGKLFAASGDSIYDITSLGGTYLNLPGVAGSYASTPNDPTNTITGDIDIQVQVSLADWTPATSQVLVAKWVGATNFRSYNFFVNTAGGLVLAISQDGTAGGMLTTGSTVATGFADGTSHWVRVTLDVNTISAHEYTFYTSTDGIVWTQLGAVVSVGGSVTIYPSKAALEIGSQDSGAGGFSTGKVYRARVYDGIGGTLAIDFNLANVAPGSTYFAVPTGQFFRVYGTASIGINGIGAASITGLTSDKLQRVNVATAGGNFLYAVNGTDNAVIYNGTAWQVVTGASVPIAVTGVNTNTLIHIEVFKNRVFFIQKDTMIAWYLPVQSVGGVASPIDFRSIFNRGGYLMAMGVWTIDGGYGMDDYAAFVTSEGQVAIYKGTDPSSADTWALVGVYTTGSPLGRRCMMKFGGDLVLICRDGLVSASKLLSSTRVNPTTNLTYKIDSAISDATAGYATAFGWEPMFFPDDDMVLLNIPKGTGLQEQYIMNTITGSWAQFQGWYANCWERFGEDMYFGSGVASGNFVAKAMNTQSDNGANITGTVVEAFSYYGMHSRLKSYRMARPIFQVNGTVGINLGMCVDFDVLSVQLGSPSYQPTTTALWDVAQWDIGLWSAGTYLKKDWQSVSAYGYAAALKFVLVSNNSVCKWLSTDYEYEVGGVL